MIRLRAAPTVTAGDSLRPPSPLDLMATAYKDWLHVNVFVPDHDITALVNVSLHGDPLSPTSIAVGTVIVFDARTGDVFATVHECVQPAADVTAASIGVGTTARVALGEDGWFLRSSGRAEAIDGSGRLAELELNGVPVDAPIEAEIPTPFGAGYVGWRAMPRLRLEGELRRGRSVVDLSSAVGYHDHNWGRWYWGDDIGWRWGTFPTVEGEPFLAEDPSGAQLPPATLTVSHRTDRTHRGGSPIARIQLGDTVRDYAGETVSIRSLDLRATAVPRLPGAIAALRSDRQRPELPQRVVVRVDDGIDAFDLEFVVDDAIQLIASEPTRSGQTFIHELTGAFELSGRVAGRRISGLGRGVFEHVG
jgi:hypothetical protein